MSFIRTNAIITFFVLIFMSACMAPTEEGMITFKGLDVDNKSSGKQGTNDAVVSNVSIVSDQLVINGTELGDITSVRVTGPSGFDQTFAIESKNATSIIANGLSNVAFAMNGLFNLILTDANGAATFQVTFTLQNGAVAANHLSSMGATTGQVLKYNGTTWVPSDLGGLTYAGNWNATTNIPNLLSGGNLGEYYIVSVAGSTDLSGGAGTDSWGVGDWVVWNNVLSRWEKVGNASSVTSFNGRSGAVTPATNDYTWAQVDKTTAPIGDLSNVNTTGAISGSVLKFDGTNWVVGTDDTASAGSVDSTAIANDSIVNADINSAAAISQSKIANLTTDLATKLSLAGGTMTGNIVMGSNNITSSGSVTAGSFVGDGSGLTNISSSAITGSLALDGNSVRTIVVDRNTTTDTSGNSLSLVAGGATSGASDKNGGDLVLSSGTSTGTGSGKIEFRTTPAGSTGTTDNNPMSAMTILGNGNVGIGTTSPAGLLDIQNEVSASGTVSMFIGSILNGVSTSFTSDAVIGDQIKCQDGEIRRINSITNDTRVTLNAAFTGTCGSGSGTYTILKNPIIAKSNGLVGLGVDSPVVRLDVLGGFQTDSAVVSGDIQASRLCDELGSNCTDLSTEFPGSYSTNSFSFNANEWHRLFETPVNTGVAYRLSLTSSGNQAKQVYDLSIRNRDSGGSAINIASSGSNGGLNNIRLVYDTVLKKTYIDVRNTASSFSSSASISGIHNISPTWLGTGLGPGDGLGVNEVVTAKLDGIESSTFGFAGKTNQFYDYSTILKWINPSSSSMDLVAESASDNSIVGSLSGTEGTNKLSSVQFYKKATDSGELRFNIKNSGNYEDVMTISSGNVGVGTTSPASKLEVNGAITNSAATSNLTSTIDFSTSNLQFTSSNCGSFDLHYMKNGGTYTFAVQGTTAATCSFSAYSDNGSTALTVHMPSGHGATNSGEHTVYTFLVMGTHVYVAWVNEFD